MAICARTANARHTVLPPKTSFFCPTPRLPFSLLRCVKRSFALTFQKTKSEKSRQPVVLFYLSPQRARVPSCIPSAARICRGERFGQAREQSRHPQVAATEWSLRRWQHRKGRAGRVAGRRKPLTLPPSVRNIGRFTGVPLIFPGAAKPLALAMQARCRVSHARSLALLRRAERLDRWSFRTFCSMKTCDAPLLPITAEP